MVDNSFYFFNCLNMIDNSFDKLTKEFRIKSFVLLTVVQLKYPGLRPFETYRTKARQTRLYANKKGKGPVARPGTSMHEQGRAVDRVFLDKNWKVTRIGDYKYLTKVWAMCWVVGVPGESCHLQDNGKTIAYIMSANSKARGKASVADGKLLSMVNNGFRGFWYK